jgi:deoxyribodipyrimidine photo-lyase
MSARHWAFVQECLTDLRSSLAMLGLGLVVRVGSMIDSLDEFNATYGIAALWSHQETGNRWTYERDLEVAAWCRSRCIPWHEERQTGVIRRLGSRDGWAKRWNRFMGEDLTPSPSALPPLDGLDLGAIPNARELALTPDPCPERQRGGRGAALERLETFLRRRGEGYRTAMSSPATGFEGCSRLSPHLAWGTLSMREVAQATWARRRELAQMRGATGNAWRGSLSSFSGRLQWHCHFMQKLEDEPSLEFENLHSAYDDLRPTRSEPAHLDDWRRGETGLPFVDACMRALAATGWMNFRMRAMLMAVASYHLWLDWRRPGEHLARSFTDYEPGIHWPQVQMQSGTTGINTVRIYNPVKQGLDQDPDGSFVRRWVPELAEVPKALLHQPWRWDGAATILGKRYPFPIVDHLAAAKDARQKVWVVRRGRAYHEQASAIQAKHGSRRSGIQRHGARRSNQRSQARLRLGPPDERA